MRMIDRSHDVTTMWVSVEDANYDRVARYFRRCQLVSRAVRPAEEWRGKETFTVFSLRFCFSYCSLIELVGLLGSAGSMGVQLSKPTVDLYSALSSRETHLYSAQVGTC